MFALGINYLNGWAMAAADGVRKEQTEWAAPPRPCFHGAGSGLVRDRRRPHRR